MFAIFLSSSLTHRFFSSCRVITVKVYGSLFFLGKSLIRSNADIWQKRCEASVEVAATASWLLSSVVALSLWTENEEGPFSALGLFSGLCRGDFILIIFLFRRYFLSPQIYIVVIVTKRGRGIMQPFLIHLIIILLIIKIFQFVALLLLEV